MRKIVSFLIRNFGVGEILFMMGMILLYRGVSATLSVAWANTVCGVILILIGFIRGREGH